MIRTYARDGIRRYPNGANLGPPSRGLLWIEEVGTLDRALYDLDALRHALPMGGPQREANRAYLALVRLLAADSLERMR